MTEDRSNLKTVTIFRTTSFLSESQKGLDEYLANSKRSIGGYWASTSSKAIGTGLTPNEQNLLLPLVLDISPEDREFRAEVRKFYEALETKVPYKTGKQLIVSLADDSSPLSKENLPVEVMDYIRYKHAIGNPEVAMSQDAATGNQLKTFYIHNPKDVKSKNTSVREKREDAMTLYLSISRDEEKVDNVIAMFGKDPRTFADESEKLDFLQAKTNSNNAEELDMFIKIVEDKDLEVKSFIKKLVQTGVLKTIGSRYMTISNNTIIGDTLEETILELQNAKNSELLVVLKSELQAKAKKVVAAKKIIANNTKD